MMRTLILFFLLAFSLAGQNRETCQGGVCVQLNHIPNSILRWMSVPLSEDQRDWSVIQIFVRSSKPDTKAFGVVLVYHAADGQEKRSTENIVARNPKPEMQAGTYFWATSSDVVVTAVSHY